MRKVLFYCLVLLSLSACGIFGLRDSEDPSAPPPWNNSTSTWEQALQNLEYCYTDNRNVVKYAGLFLPSFRFYFAPQDVVDYNLPANWERSDEQDMLINLHSFSSKISLALEPIPGSSDEILLNEARIFRSYQITNKISTGNRYYYGSFEIQLKRENGYWYIQNWYDYRQGNASSWGKLKHDYSQ